MAFLTGTIAFKAYTDSAQTEFPQELVSDLSKDFANSALTGVESSTFSIAALGTQTINFNSVSSVKRFYIYSNTADITVNMNSLGNITCKAGIPGLVPFTVTTLIIGNSSASLATTVTVILFAE